MANGGRIDWTLGFKVDKSGLNDLKNSFNEIRKILPSDLVNLNAYSGTSKQQMNQALSDFQKMKITLDQVEKAFDSAFDSTTGITNLQKLNASLKSIGVDKLSSQFSKFGTAGNQAFLQIAKGALTTKMQLKENVTLLDKMGQTFANTIKWSISSSIINKFTGSIQQAWGYIQHLDTSLNDIRIVTGKSADEMDRFAIKANKAAQSLGAATTDYTEAALIYYQQGLSDEEAQARAETTLKAANVTGQTGKEVSEQLTAVWNGYKVTAEETEMYVDKLAAVAATTASDLEELSTGMSKVASAANNMGVDVDQLNAQLATIISVTRQAPETAGTALKTIYARLEDLKISGEDEEGVKLGEVSSTLDELGIHVMDAEGNLRDLGEVIEEVASKWDTWTDAQQSAAAQAMAGKRQYNNLLALFDNWDMYISALETSRNSLGTLQEQQDIYMESIAAHLQQMKTAAEGVYQSLSDTGTINNILDTFTGAINLFNDFINGIGGGNKAFLMLGSTIVNVFSKQLGKGISDAILSFTKFKNNAKELQAQLDNIQLFKKSSQYQSNEALKVLVDAQSQVSAYYGILNNEQINAVNGLIDQAVEAKVLEEQWKKDVEAVEEYASAMQQVEGSVKFTKDNGKTQYYSTKDFNFNSESIKNQQALEQRFKQSQTTIDNLRKSYRELTSSTEALGKETTETFQRLKDGYTTLKNGSEISKTAQNNYKKLTNTISSVEEEFNKLNKAGLLKNVKPEDVNAISNAFIKLKNSGNLNALQQNFEDLKLHMKGLPEEAQNLLDSFNKLQMQGNNLDFSGPFERLKITLQQMELQQITTSIVNGISSIGQFASGINSLDSALSSLGDTSLTTKEKVTQFLSGLGMSVVMLSSSFKGIASAGSVLNSVLNKQLAIKRGLILADGTATEKGIAFGIAQNLQDDATKSLTQSIIEEQAALSLTNPTMWLIIGAMAALAVVIGSVVAAYNNHIEALQREAEKETTLSKELHDTTTKMKEQAEAASELVNKYNDLTRSSADFRTQVHDLLVEYGYWTEANKALTASYAELDEMIKNIQDTANQEAINAANKQLEQDKKAVASNIWAKGKDDSETSFDEVNGKRTIDLSDTSSIQNILDKYQIKTLDSWGHIDLQDFSNAVVDHYNELFADLSKSDSASAQELLDYINNYIDTELLNGIKDAQSLKVDKTEQKVQNSTDWNSKIKDVESYNKAVEEYAKQIAPEGATSQQMEESLEKAKAYLATVSNFASQIQGFNQQVQQTGLMISDGFKIEDKDIETMNKAKEAMNKAIKENYNGDETKFFEDLEKGIAVGFDSTTEGFQEYSELIEKYGKIYEKQYGEVFDWEKMLKVDPTSLTKTVSSEMFNTISNAILQADPTGKFSSYFTPDDWAELLGLSEENMDKLPGIIEDKIQTAYQQAFNNLKENADIVEGNFQELITQNIDGKVATDDKSVYQALKPELETLLEFYPELQDEVNTFNNEALIGTKAWTDAVYVLKDAYNDLGFERLKESYQQDFNDLQDLFTRTEKQYASTSNKRNENGQLEVETVEVPVEPDIEEFSQSMDELMEDDYSITVEVQSDIDDSFDNAVSSMENLDKMASKIGEDFIVSAEDITEIAEAYPGILEGYTDLGNGTIQLNEEIAKSAMTKASQEEVAAAKAFHADVERYTKSLKLKNEEYQHEIDIAKAVLQGKKDATEAANELSESEARIKEINDDMASEAQEENAADVASNSEVNAKVVSDNWGDAYNNMASSALKAAEVAIDAAAAVANNNAESLGKLDPNVKVDWKGGGKGTESSIDTSTKTYVKDDGTANTEAFQKIIDTREQGIKLNNESIARAEAEDAEFAARLGKSVKANSEVGKPKEDSSSKSSSEKEAKHEDHLEREADLYRNINSELKQIESTLGRIQKENNYKWGKDLQEGLKRENKLLDQQLAKLQEKSKIQQKDLATRRAQLEAQGYQFSEDGSTITNAEAKLDTLYAQYNQMIDNYNSMSADQQEEYKKQLDEEKKNIDKIEKGLKDYESLFSDYQGTLDSILDLHYQQIENAVSRFNNMVDVHLELDNARKEWNDFWYEVVEDAENLNFGTNIDYFEKKIEQSMGKLSTLLGIGGNAKDSEISTLTKHLNETVTQVEAQIASKNRGGEDSLFEDATKLSKENLETYREKLMSALREAKEEVNNIAENYLNLLDTAQNKIDKQIDGWESISNHIEHNLELIKLVSGEKAFAPLLKQYDKLYETNLKTIEAQKTGQDYWADQIQKYEKLLKTTEEGTVQWKTYSKALETASENYKKSVEGLDKSVEKALKDLEEWRKTQVESILDTLDKAMTHGAGLEFVKEEWNLINEYSSRYLDNVERAVETQLYTNDLEKAANATGLTAKNQERINKFREEELKKLKEKAKLSQYDIDESRARLNILQQEIALEEARNNKSNMRLRRDSQGNYTYQYTGDEAAQDEAENGLLTAKKEWYELVKNRHKETTDWIIEDTQRYYDYIKKADEERAKGNEEGYKNYMNLAQEAYKAIEDDAAEMNKNAQDLLSGTAQFFSDVKDASILPTSKAMAASMNKDIGTIKEAGEKAVNALTATQEKFGEKTKKILEQAGINYENLAEKGIDPTQDALEDLNGTNEELEQSLEDVNKVLEEQESLLAEAEEAYNNFKDAAVEALEAAQRAWEELAKTVIESQHQIQAEIQTTQQMQQQSNATSPSAFRSTREDSGGGDGGNSSSEMSGKVVQNNAGQYELYIDGKSTHEYYGGTGTSNSAQDARDYFEKKHNIKVYDTGGYTGNWNSSDGKLAVLHQKELVLNESDTSNLLKAINVLRQVVASMNFSGIADSLVNSTTQWMNKAAMQPLTAGNISNISSVNNDTNNNYKNVTVNADFSGVQSAEAIYQALTELENYGMQESYSVAPYANKSY